MFAQITRPGVRDERERNAKSRENRPSFGSRGRISTERPDIDDVSREGKIIQE